MTETELVQRLGEIRRQPAGPAQFAAWDELFRHADAAGAVEFGLRARLEAISDFEHNADPARAILAFSWCVATTDRRPELLQDWQLHSFLWMFKWIVGSLPDFPEVPRHRVFALLDDMERRYRINGNNLHAMAQYRMVTANAVGDAEGAAEWYQRLRTAARGDLSDCRVCVPNSELDHLVLAGKYEEAIAVGEPWKKKHCLHQPHGILADLTFPYLMTGAVAKAVDAHRVGYGLVRNNPTHLGNVAAHLRFCALSGNAEAGLVILERHLSWLDRPKSPGAEMRFAASGAAVLRGLLDIAGDRPIARRSPDGSRRWSSSVAELHVELTGRAVAIARRFDARNGNSVVGDRVAECLQQEPIREQVPLTVLAGRRIGKQADPRTKDAVRRVAELTAAGDEVGAARARLEVAQLLAPIKQRRRDAAEAAEEAVRELDRVGLTDEAVRARFLLWELYRNKYKNREDAIAILDTLRGADLPADLPPLHELLEFAGDEFWGEQRAGWLLEAADRHRDAGRVADEFRLVRKALDALDDEDARWASAFARAEALHADGSLSDVDRARYVLIAAEAWTAEGRADEALAGLTAAAALLEEDDRDRAATALARMYLDRGDAVRAEALAREVLEREWWWSASITLIRALRAQGKDDEATAYMTEHDIDEDELD